MPADPSSPDRPDPGRPDPSTPDRRGPDADRPDANHPDPDRRAPDAGRHHSDTTADTARLRDSWTRDLARFAPEASSQLVADEMDLLLSGWSEPHRSYHTVQHLTEVLDAVDHLAAAGETDAVDARLARMAGWFHDLAYDPQAAAGSNEHRSATMARDHLHALGVARGTIDVVEALILMTIEHDGDSALSALASHRHTAAVFHDADLWILSAPEGRYREYMRQVRREYAHVPADLFARGRGAILRGFAQRESIYRTATARREWEAAARRNLAEELRHLS